MSDIVADLLDVGKRPAAAAAVVAPSWRGESALAEAMDGAFARLLPLLDARGALVVHVTAATKGEGTTTISAALAAAAGRADWCRTALIDANPVASGPLSRPVLLARGGADAAPVLRQEVLHGSAMDTALLHGPGAGPHSAERLRTLFGALRQSYGLTVIDGPPVLSAPDAVCMARHADGVVLVVGAEQVRAANMKRALGALAESGAGLLGTVLNRTQNRLPGFLAGWL